MSAQAELLDRVAAADPQLAARAVLMMLPAAAARVPGTLVWDLTVDGLGSHRVRCAGGRARLDAIAAERAGDDDAEFHVTTDPAGLLELAGGRSGALRLALRGKLRIRGKRRRALRLRAMGAATELGLGDVAAAGGTLEPAVVYGLLAHSIDPEWTRGHSFAVDYTLVAEGGGATQTYRVGVDDGAPVAVSAGPGGGADATVSIPAGDFARLATGELSPNRAMQERITVVDGELHPVTLLGRWIARGAGEDEGELARETRQRERQARRRGIWGSAPASGAGQGDPGHRGRSAARSPIGRAPQRPLLSEQGAREGGGLLGYTDLYGLWERQGWSVADLDFRADQEHWLATPSEAQQSTIWSLGSFYVAEERVTADLAPFLAAAPTAEIEIFLATQLADEARHAAFFDRFAAEVMCLEADDLRGRLRDVEGRLSAAWRDVFDDGLRRTAERLRERPGDIDLMVEGVATYHLVLEGFLAVTGQTFIRGYMEEHSIYPGFCRGFELVERDEHRHIAFGVRFLRDAIDTHPRHRETIERTVLDLVPRAALALVPPYARDPADFTSYGYHSSEIYGFAYRTLTRRMAVLGIEIPPAAELMPGRIEQPGLPAPAPPDGSSALVPVAAAAGNGASATAPSGPPAKPPPAA